MGTYQPDDPANPQDGNPINLPEYTVEDIVVTGQRRVPIRLKDIRPETIYDHFLHGEGIPVCLTTEQFLEVARKGTKVGAPKSLADGQGYAWEFSMYGSDLRWSFGTLTLYTDGGGTPMGAYDFYDFDAHGRVGFSAQAMTAIGYVGYGVGGQDFTIQYNHGTCNGSFN